MLRLEIRAVPGSILDGTVRVIIIGVLDNLGGHVSI